MDYPGWSIETTHPVDPESAEYCPWCADMVPRTVAFAADWGSTAHGAVEFHPEEVEHRVTVRAV